LTVLLKIHWKLHLYLYFLADLKKGKKKALTRRAK